LLVYARNRRLSGTLEVRAADGRSGTLELWRGRIDAARTRTSPAVVYFGAVAYELGVIDTATLDATLLEIAKSKRLHGEVLVERGTITAEQRDTILAEQTCRKVHHLFTLPPDSMFAFYDAQPSAEEPSFTLDPIRPAWRGLRESPLTESVRAVMARYTSATLRMSNEGPISSAGLDPDEKELCEALTWKPMTLAQLRATSTLPAQRVDLLVYLLFITKCVESTATSSATMKAASPSQSNMQAPRPSMSFKVPSTSAFRAASPSSTERRAVSSSRMTAAPDISPVFSPSDLGAVGIAHRASVIASEDPFAILGIPQGASSEAARAAFFRLSKLWHPDRLPPELAPFRREVETIFNHMSAAHRTLTDPEPQKEGKPTPPEQARPRHDVIREIEQALSKHDYQSAETMARELADANADDAEAHALIGWAIMHGGEGNDDRVRLATASLEKAVKADNHCERAHFYRGIMHKRLGNGPAALRDFSHVLALDPKHVDAQREVRIFEMRARRGSGEHALDVLLSKVKKK
jgi:hypothetical protein